MTDKHRAKRTKVDYTDAFTVVVGKGQQSFLLHTDKIIEHSKFFEAACKGSFKEAKEKKIQLPDVDVATFKRYVHWVYTGDVDITPTSGQNGALKGMKAATQLYVLGDRFESQDLRNAAIDAIFAVHEKYGQAIGTEVVCLAYEETCEGSHLQRLFVDYYAWVKDPEWFKVQKEDCSLPTAFLFDLIARSKEKDNKDPFTRNRCAYHHHSHEGAKCSSST